nr:MAG TPA: endonuclease [Caudoviricetes sp.]
MLIRTERHIIDKNNINYKNCIEICHLSKNLYNYVNYILRQSFFNTGSIPGEYEINKLLAKENQPDFRALPSNVSQLTVNLVFKAWKSFFMALKSYKKDKSKFKSNPKLPKYKSKNGLYICAFTYNSAKLKDNKIKFVKNILKPIKTKVSRLKQVRVVPNSSCFIVEIVYEKDVKETLKTSGSIASIDLGLNNFITCIDNLGNVPLIINGKGLKSYNRLYNKKKAKLQSLLPLNRHSSNKIRQLEFNRYKFVSNFMHQASKMLLNILLDRKIETLIIGYNKEWKQNINLSKKVNQSFVQIPYTSFLQKILYKCEEYGIKVILTEESYTSKIDHLANEPLTKRDSYLGKRIYRGLFKSSVGKILNADVNGALGIMRKVFPEKVLELIRDSGVVYTPVIINPIKI